jgi:hypothetical protein
VPKEAPRLAQVGFLKYMARQLQGAKEVFKTWPNSGEELIIAEREAFEKLLTYDFNSLDLNDLKYLEQHMKGGETLVSKVLGAGRGEEANANLERALDAAGFRRSYCRFRCR